MEKSAVFNSRLLPYVLLVPQLIITFVFFYWPASQAVWQSFLREDAFGLTFRIHRDGKLPEAVRRSPNITSRC